MSNFGFSEGKNFPFTHSLEMLLGEQMCIQAPLQAGMRF